MRQATIMVSWLAMLVRNISAFVTVAWQRVIRLAMHMLDYRWLMVRSTMVLIFIERMPFVRAALDAGEQTEVHVIISVRGIYSGIDVEYKVRALGLDIASLLGKLSKDIY